MEQLSAVIGGCGFIGAYIVRRLLARNLQVNVLDDLSTGQKDKLPSDRRLRFIRGCVTDRDAVAEATRGARSVFHLASIVGQKLVSKNAAWTYKVSATGTQHVLDCARNAITVVVSSSAIYGFDSVGAVDESAPLSWDACLEYDGGIPGYACGKFSQEVLASEKAGLGQRVIVVRPFNVIGYGQQSTYGMVVPRFIENAITGRPLTIYDDGLQRRSFSCVETFVNSLLRLVDGAEEKHFLSNIIFNIGSPQTYSIIELANIVETVINRPFCRQFVPYISAYPGKRDVRSRKPVLDRLEKVLGPIQWPNLESIVCRLVSKSSETNKKLPH